MERPKRDRRLFWFIPLGHDSGLALIYGAVLGAWFYPLTSAFLGLTLGPVGLDPEVRQGVSLLFALIMVWLFVRELLRLDDPKIKGRFPNLFPGFFKPRNPENTHSQNTTREQPGEQQPGEQRRRG